MLQHTFVRTTLRLLVAVAVLFAVPESKAQCGNGQWLAVDGVPGLNGSAYVSLAWDPDGPGPRSPGIVVGGAFTFTGTSAANNIVFWDSADGTWSSLGTGTNDYVGGLAVLPNGDLVVGGGFTSAGGVPANRVAKWNGTSWAAVGTGVNSGVTSLAVLTNGDLIAGGSFTSAGGVPANRIARWNGLAWSALGAGTNNTVSALIRLSNGDLIAGGHFTTAGGVTANRIARWNGITWAVLGTGMNNAVWDIVAQPNGDVIAAGQFTTAGGVAANRIARWNGNTWSALGSGMDNTVGGLASLPNGDVIASGYFGNAGGVSANRIARWNGSSWSGFGSGSNGVIQSVVALTDSVVIAVGGFTLAGGRPVQNVARWNGESWERLSGGTNGAIHAIATTASGSYVAAGDFTLIGGVEANRIALWNGNGWSALGTGMNDRVVEVVELPNHELIAVGSFTVANGVPTNRIARWTGSGWVPMGTGLNNAVTGVAVLANGDIVVSGSFSQAGGVAASRVARWNGTVWSAIGSGITDPLVTAVSRIRVLGNSDLIVGGAFGQFELGGPEHFAKRWNGASWIPYANASNGQLWYRADTVEVDSQGGVILSGSFSDIENVPAQNIARTVGNAWQGLGTGLDGLAYSVVSLADGSLIAGGEFTTAGGIQASRIARWSGARWTTLGSGVNGAVNALAVLPNGDILAGGNFTSAGDGVSAYLARWRANTGIGPIITTQPSPMTVCPTDTAQFSVQIVPEANLNYTWRLDGQPLTDGPLPSGAVVLGSSTSTLQIGGVTAQQAGALDCVISRPPGGPCNTTTSNPATLTVLEPRVTLVQSPLSQALDVGTSTTLTVQAPGAQTYQWRRNGTAIVGETSSTLTLSNADASTAGSYDVICASTCNTVTSEAAAVTVNGPDIIVSQATAPATAVATQTYRVTWRLGNAGNRAAAGPWSDALFWRPAAGNDIPAGVFICEQTSLAVNATADCEALVQAPSMAGTYRLFVRADSANQVSELQQDNNLAVSDATVEVTALPLPNLVVSDLTYPTQPVPSSSLVDIEFTVTNTGTVATATTSWTDLVFLTLDRSMQFCGTCPANEANAQQMVPCNNNCDQIFANLPTDAVGFQNVRYLPAGASYRQRIRYRLPSDTAGAYYVNVLADKADGVHPNSGVREVNKNNNILVAPTPIQVELEDQPDLQVIAGSITAPAIAQTDQALAISYGGENSTSLPGSGGLPDQPFWLDSVYLSRNNLPEISVDDILAGEFPHGGPALAPDQVYLGETTGLRVRADWEGDYYVKVKLDGPAGSQGTITEAGLENNNIGVSSATMRVLRAIAPDLVIVNPQGPSTEVVRGVPFSIGWGGRDDQQTAPRPVASNWSDRVLLSTDAVPDSGDLELAARPASSSPTSTGDHQILAYSRQATVTIPGSVAPGAYQLLFVADGTNQVFEGICTTACETNNVAALPLQVSAAAPDLVPQELMLSQTDAAPGSTMSVTYRVRNQGDADAGAPGWSDRLVFSLDQIHDSNDTFLAADSRSATVASNGEYVVTTSIQVPQRTPTSGYVLLITDVGNSLFEATAEGNNLIASALAINADGPDLAVTEHSVPSSVAAGSPITIEWTVTNIGSQSTEGRSAWQDNMKLVQGNTIIELGTVPHSGVLSPSAAYTGSRTASIPANAPPGSYQLIIETDSQLGAFEVNEGNNTRTASVTVLAGEHPDLVVLDLDAPITVFAGQPLAVSATVRNVGGGIATHDRGWYDRLYLSRDQSFGPDDTFVGRQIRAADVQPGDDYVTTIEGAVSQGLDGVYFPIVVADAEASIYEITTGEQNNWTAGFMPVIVEQPEPSDLVVESVSVPTGTLYVNDMVTVTWTVRNAGAAPISGSWSDTVLISNDEVLDAADIVVGSLARVHDSELAPGATEQHSLAVRIPGTLPSTYHVVIQTDDMGGIPESNESNNTTASAGTSIDIPYLQSGPALPVVLPRIGAAYFRIPAASSHGWRLHVAGTDASQLRIAYDESVMPRYGTSDVSASAPQGVDVNLLLPSPTDTLAAVQVSAGDFSGSTTLVHVTLEPVAIGPSTVMPSTIGTGSVTTRVRGVWPSLPSKLRLRHASGLDEVESAQFFFSSPTDIVAIWNLAGAVTGPYLLEAVMGDDVVYQLPDAVQVQEGFIAEASAEILSLPAMRRGRSDRALLLVHNPSNIDMAVVQLSVYCPESPQDVEARLVVDNGETSDSVPLSESGSVTDASLYRLAAHETRVLVVRLNVPAMSQATEVRLAADAQTYSSFGAFVDARLRYDLIGYLATLPGGSPQAESSVDDMRDSLDLLYQTGLLDDSIAGTLERGPTRRSVGGTLKCWATCSTLRNVGCFVLGVPLADGVISRITNSAARATAVTVSGGVRILVRASVAGAAAWVLCTATGGQDCDDTCQDFGTVPGVPQETLCDLPNCWPSEYHASFSGPRRVELVLRASGDGQSECTFAIVFGPKRDSTLTACPTNPDRPVYCWRCREATVRAKCTPIVGSADPNDKSTESTWVASSGTARFRVNFENLSAATAPAALVQLEDQLAGAWLPGSVRFTRVNIGGYEHQVSELNGLTSVADTGAAEPVAINALVTDIGDSSGTIVVNMQSIGCDNCTGFLPPEDGTGRGQGFIEFTVRVRDDVPTGTEIRNTAAIRFDVNDVIVTNETLHYVDATLPMSDLSALPPASPPGTLITTATASDPAGAGLRGWQLWMSVDGGQWAQATQETSDSTTSVTLSPGHVYRLSSRATDLAGNEEPLNEVGDAMTTVPGSDLASSSDSGLHGDRITNDSTPLLVVVAPPLSTTDVSLVGPTTVSGTVQVGANGRGTWQVPATLPDGTYAVSVQSGTVVVTQQLIIDTQAPTTLAWAAVAQHGGLNDVAILIAPDGTTSEPRQPGIRRVRIVVDDVQGVLPLQAADVEVMGLTITNQPVNLSGITKQVMLLAPESGYVVEFEPALPDRAKYCITLRNAKDRAGNEIGLGAARRTVTALKGDSTNDRRTNSTDVGGVNSLVGTNPIDRNVVNHVRSDLNVDGQVTSADRDLALNLRGADARFIADPCPLLLVGGPKQTGPHAYAPSTPLVSDETPKGATPTTSGVATLDGLDSRVTPDHRSGQANADQVNPDEASSVGSSFDVPQIAAEKTLLAVYQVNAAKDVGSVVESLGVKPVRLSTWMSRGWWLLELNLEQTNPRKLAQQLSQHELFGAPVFKNASGSLTTVPPRAVVTAHDGVTKDAIIEATSLAVPGGVVEVREAVYLVALPCTDGWSALNMMRTLRDIDVVESVNPEPVPPAGGRRLGDFNGDAEVTLEDIDGFLALYVVQDLSADLDGDGQIANADLQWLVDQAANAIAE